MKRSPPCGAKPEGWLPSGFGAAAAVALQPSHGCCWLLRRHELRSRVLSSFLLQDAVAAPGKSVLAHFHAPIAMLPPPPPAWPAVAALRRS